MSLAMRGVLVVIGLGASACGQITFGSDLVEGDGGVVVEDAMPVDVGVDAGPMDLGCVPATRPPLPTAWPYPATKTGYLENFYNNLPDPEGCGLKTCHGPDPDMGGMAKNLPLIPKYPTDLDPPGVVDQAIATLWATVTPEGAAALVQTHDPDSPGFVETGGDFTDDELIYLREFVARSYQCAWKDYVPPTVDAGTPPDTGVGDAAPTDAAPGDAAASDGGPAADAAPVDTGPVALPICPVMVDTSHCSN